MFKIEINALICNYLENIDPTLHNPEKINKIPKDLYDARQAINVEVKIDTMRTDVLVFILLLCILAILITLIAINL